MNFEHAKKCIANDQCPFCGADAPLEEGTPECEEYDGGPAIVAEYGCGDCKKTWKETYIFAAATEIEADTNDA